MYSAKELAIARLIKPDIEVTQLDVTDLAVLQLVRKATGGGSGVYNATIENGIATFGGVVASQPLVSLLLNLSVTQTGSGTSSPDNKRDFIGVSGVNIPRTGKNLFDLSRFAAIYPSYCSWSDSVLTINNANSVLYTTGIEVNIPSDSSECYLSFEIKNETATTPRVRIQYSDGTVSEHKPAEYDGWTKYEGLLNAKRITAIKLNWLSAGTFSLRNFCINFYSSDNDYEPYTGNTYQITFGQTVYSAILDVLRGKLYLIDEIKTIDENSGVVVSSTNNNVYICDDVFNIDEDTESINCNVYQRAENRSSITGVVNNNPDLSFCCKLGANPTRLLIKDTRFTSTEDYNTWLANNPVKIAVKLAEPIEIDITPTVINTLIGDNVIFADVADVTECKYTRK